MNFQSRFDKAIARADNALTRTFACVYTFELTTSETVSYQCIYDTKLLSQSAEGTPVFKEVKNGILKVLNQRISKDLIVDATVQTQLGQRRVANVLYPEPTVCVLVLSPLGESETLNEVYGF